jgi:uncharacterized protein YegJ (DUF2314 family)
MKKLITVFSLLTLALFIHSCNRSSQDKVVSVEANDAEMNAAIAKARASLPQFWTKFDHPAEGESDFCLKVKITGKEGVEHFWLGDLAKTNGALYGTINNDADIVHSVKIGDRIKIPEADISDWLYERNGKMYGNYTVRVLFKQMPADEVAKLKAMLADP